MRINPFQSKKSGNTSIQTALSNVFSTKEVEPLRKKQKKETPPEEVPNVDEEAVQNVLAKQKMPATKNPLLPSNSMYNYISASVGEPEKILLEKKLESTVYYQTPETHTIRKEEGHAYNYIFQNWRKGLSGLFAEYRKANAKNIEFAFYAYSDKIIYYFHTVGYKSCSYLCCADSSSYALHAISTHSLSELFDSKFKQDKNGWYLSGRSVLFILDILINTQATTVCALPLIISKYPFTNGIITRPTIKIKPEKHLSKNTYRISINGWVLSEDILMLNRSIQLEAKQTNDI